VALKLNTKLTNSINNATAWTLDHPTDGLIWMKEASTLLMGLSTISGQGQAGTTYVVGSACLDKFGMRCCQDIRVQTRGSFIAQDLLLELTKVRL
jgi:hypothetical protein